MYLRASGASGESMEIGSKMLSKPGLKSFSHDWVHDGAKSIESTSAGWNVLFSDRFFRDYPLTLSKLRTRLGVVALVLRPTAPAIEASLLSSRV